MKWLMLAVGGLLAACATVSAPATLPAELNGTWRYLGGEPTGDALLSWSDWPDVQLTIDAARGVWKVVPALGKRSVLPPVSRVTAVAGPVLTLVSDDRRRPFQIYWRMEGEKLEFWWGDHADWLKPYVVYERP